MAVFAFLLRPIHHCAPEDNSDLTANSLSLRGYLPKKKLLKRARDVAVVWYRFYCPALLAVAVALVEPIRITMP